jgi:biopolymer transport protein ExbD
MGNRTHNPIQSTINVTPLVDVALTLLQQGLPVNLPQAAAPALKRTRADVILTIRRDGNIYLGDETKPIPTEELEGRLTAIYSARQSKDLYIKADTDLRYGAVVQVMSLAKKAGVYRIGMITQPETEAPKR